MICWHYGARLELLIGYRAAHRSDDTFQTVTAIYAIDTTDVAGFVEDSRFSPLLYLQHLFAGAVVHVVSNAWRMVVEH